jgi:hypothetical protein
MGANSSRGEGWMATFEVTTTEDVVNSSDGLVSLREALTMADADPGGDRILFSPFVQGQVITLANGQLTAASDVTIANAGSPRVTVDAGQASRVLAILGNGTDVTIENLRIVAGRLTELSGAATSGGINAGAGTSLVLISSTVEGNSVTGFGAEGGGIFAAADADIDGPVTQATATTCSAARSRGAPRATSRTSTPKRCSPPRRSSPAPRSVPGWWPTTAA